MNFDEMDIFIFFTPYKISGLIKKKVSFSNSIVSEAINNIFE